jgi:hypothetical protein
MRLFVGALLACGLVGLAREAFAQNAGFVERQTREGQDVRFEDDPLGALPPGSVGTIFDGHRYTVRFQLIRPRSTFVPEMLKNVETL